MKKKRMKKKMMREEEEEEDESGSCVRSNKFFLQSQGHLFL
jgi:hypothetical protein